MPPKHALKERAWGTRYDTLTSPSTSPPLAQPQATTTAPPTIQHRPDDKNADPGAIVTKSEQSRNDSSIFVGSLPANIIPEEVARALSQHLAEHSEIVNIKATNDKKGGMCAFIQCQNDEAAARLLHTLQNKSQRPFLGRILRFELARSPRTLLISYRTPVRQAYPNSGFDPSDDLESIDRGLPKCMRIVRANGAKCVFLWDTAALEYDQSFQGMTQLVASDQSVSKDILFSPLRFDADTLREIARAFGPLESFSLYEFKAEEREGQDISVQAHIPEHSGPRAPGMESGVWEVKWKQRDDCAAALSALRRTIPHLAVTWAHHHFSSSGQDSRYASPVASPNSHSSYRTRIPRQPRPYVSGGDYHRLGDPSPHAIPSHALSPSSRLRFSSSPSTSSIGSPNLKNWAPAYSSPQLRMPSSPAAEHDGQDTTTDTTLVQDWAEVDSSSVHDAEWESEGFQSSSALALPWILREDREDELCSITSPSPSSSLSVQPATPMSADALESFAKEQADAKYCGFIDRSGSGSKQSVTDPSTPGFSQSSLTPVTPKTNHSLPQTPQSTTNASLPGVDFAKSPVFQTTPKKNARIGIRGDVRRDIPEFDPMTIWVGGLDTSRWGEARIRAVFEKYGTIEELELHTRETPSFAFVKFRGMESSTRAVSQENDRYYDGRPIRVAIKQLNPLARGSPMKFSRGRGRQRVFDVPQQRLRANIEGHVDGSPYGQSPRRAVSQDPFRVSTGSPTSVSGLSARKETSENSLGITPMVGNQPSPTSSNAPRNLPFAFDVCRDGPTSAISSSPAPSSGGQSSALPGPMPPYSYYPPHWMPYTYGYHMPYGYFPPMQPPSSRDGSEQPPGVQWMPVNQAYKGPPGHHLPPPGEVSQTSPYQHHNAQPPLHPTGFYQSDHGTLVALYPAEALMNYQMTKEVQTSPPPQGSSQQHPPPPPAAWYPSLQMPPYPYPYGPVPYPPGGMPANTAIPQPTSSGWGSAPAGPYSAQRPQPLAVQHPTPTPYMMPSVSSSSVNSSASFGSAHPPPYHHAEQNVGPRHALMNKRFPRNTQNQGYHNRNSAHRFNGRTGYSMEPSQSYVDPPTHGQYPGPVRLSGSHPAHLESNAPSM